MDNGFTYRIGLDVFGNSDLGRLLNSLDKINRTMDMIERNTNQTSLAMQSFANRGSSAVAGLSSSFGNLIGTVGGTAVAMKTMSLAANMESTNLAFEVMMKSASGAKEMVSDLVKFGDVTPFSNTEVLESGKSMLAYGFKADSVMDKLRMLGDVASGTNTPFNEMTQMFGKMKMQTIAHTDDLMQLANRGIPIIDILSTKWGVSTEAVFKFAEKGKISFSDIEYAFQKMSSQGGLFENMMARQSETLTGKWSTFQASLEMLGVKIGTELLPAATNFLNNYLIPSAHWIGEHLDLMEKWAFGIGSVVLGLKAYNTIAAIAAWRTAALATNFAGLGKLTLAQSIANIGLTSSIWAMTLAMLANPVTWITVGLVALGGAIWYAYNHSKTFRGIIGGLWEVLQYLYDRISSVIGVIIKFGTAIWNKMKPTLQALGQFLYEVSMPIQGLVWLLGQAVKAVLDFLGISDAFNKGFDNTMMVEKFGETIPVINDTTKAVLGLTDAYYKMNEQSMASAQANKDFLFNNNYENKAPLVAKFFKDDATKDHGKPDDKLQKGIDGITGGGRQTRIITFNNVKVGERIEIHTTNMKEGAGEAGEMVRREFLQLLNSANQVQ